MKLLLVTFLATILAGPAISGNLYKWVDAEGRVHFSDRPMNSAAQEIEVPKSPNLNHVDGQSARQSQALRQRALNNRRDPRVPQLSKLKPEKSKKKKATRGTAEESPASQLDARTRQAAIRNCEEIAFRKNCDSEEMIWKHRPRPPLSPGEIERRRLRWERRPW